MLRATTVSSSSPWHACFQQSKRTTEIAAGFHAGDVFGSDTEPPLFDGKVMPACLSVAICPWSCIIRGGTMVHKN